MRLEKVGVVGGLKLREEAISFEYLIEYDGGVLRGRVGSTKDHPLPWTTREGAERALARATSLRSRHPHVVVVALIQLPEHFEGCPVVSESPSVQNLGCSCDLDL